MEYTNVTNTTTASNIMARSLIYFYEICETFLHPVSRDQVDSSSLCPGVLLYRGGGGWGGGGGLLVRGLTCMCEHHALKCLRHR